MKKTLIFDGNNLVMRYALTPGFDRMSYSNEPTGGIHGAVQAILQHIDALKPDNILVVFDGKDASKNKRKIYSGYKANRGPAKDGIVGQMEATRNVLRAAGIRVFHENGYEADDVIGTVAAHEASKQRSVLIVSADKDFFQLTSPYISVLRPKMDLWDWRRVKREIIHPRRFAEYLALVGDSVDGIPGLNNCGPVSAKQLLSEYSWAELLKSPPPKFQDAVNAQRKDLKAFLQLTKISENCLSAKFLKNYSLVPSSFNPQLWELLRSKNLRALEKWFRSKGNNVLSTKSTLFSTLGDSAK